MVLKAKGSKILRSWLIRKKKIQEVTLVLCSNLATLLLCKKIGTELNSQKGSTFAMWEKANGQIVEQSEIDKMKANMRKSLDLDFPNETVNIVNGNVEGIDFPFLICFLCKKKLQPYMRKNKKTGKVTRLDASGYKRHVAVCRQKALDKNAEV